MSNLEEVLKQQGDLAAARAHFESALKIDKTFYGLDHPEVTTDAGSLGLVLQELGDLVGARAQLERALKIDQTVYGPDHRKVGRDVNDLGSCCNGRAIRWQRGYSTSGRSRLMGRLMGLIIGM